MPQISLDVFVVNEALNEMGPVKRSQRLYRDIKYICDFCLKSNITKVSLESKDLIFLDIDPEDLVYE